MQDENQQTYSRLGVLDIGSNSVRLVIYQLFGASFTPVYNEKVLAGLGRDLRQTGCLSVPGRKMALAALKRFAVIAKAQRLETVLIGATAALREAKDAQVFIDQVYSETGLNIRPVSGAEEARLTAMGVVAAEYRADGVAADLGGASLELIQINNGQPEPGISFPVGPFQIMGQNIGDSADFDPESLKKRIESFFADAILPECRNRPLYLVGGAWRNLAAVHQDRADYPLNTLQNYTLNVDEAKALAHWSYSDGREEVLNWPGINSRRAETLPYSGFMLELLIARLKPSAIVISASGLREGLIYDALSDALKARDSLYDGCRDLARGNLQEVHFDGPLYNHLSDVASHFPSVFEAENESRLRRAACSLVGIGKGLHPDYRAALVFEEVFYAPLSDLSHKERAYLALILFASYTGQNKTPNDAAVQLLLSPEEQTAARIYGFAIRLAVVASGRSSDLLEKVSLKFEDDVLVLIIHPEYSELLSERVLYRLNKLGQLANLETRSEVQA